MDFINGFVGLGLGVALTGLGLLCIAKAVFTWKKKPTKATLPYWHDGRCYLLDVAVSER